jgi:hypothetical protein
VSAKRPINADVPPVGEPAEEASPPPKSKRRTPVPLTLKLLAATVVLAIGFIVAAVVGGSGGGDAASVEGPAPAPASPLSTPGAPASQTPEALGYPSFATDNTTRVGGSDAASNAAAVALAVFPATTTSQRPGAVTLVGEDDWAGAIAASVLMARPVRAPVLFSGADGLPEPTAAALAAFELTSGDSVFAIGDLALPRGLFDTTRVDSGDAASTAAQIETLRDRLFGSPPAHVVIAPSDRPDLAMPAAAWAARSGDPVLFSGDGKLPQPTTTALKRHSDVPVYILGPSSAISSAVVREIAGIVKRVKRVSGEDAVANAIAFARYRDGSFGWNVNDPGHGFVLARSDAPLEAAAAAALSASGTWGPLLLSDDAGTLPAELRSYFLDVKPGYTTNPTRAFYNHVWVIGDQEAIDVNQQAEVNELAELAKIGGER